jgi:protein-disulfide isomerase
MPSGKQSKRRRAQARAAPPPVRRKGERRTASPKILIAVAVAIALIGGAVGAALALTGGSKSSSKVPARGTLVGALPEAAEVHRLFQDIPQTGNVLGSSKAPVTLIEYIDLQCPGCQAFETQVFPGLVPPYIRSGKLKVEARPIAFIGPDSQRGRLAALAAARQNRFFNYAQLLYFNQGTENTGWLDDGMVKAVAASIPGLEVPQLLTARDSASISSEARSFDSKATSDQVASTPTLLIGRTGGPTRRVTADSAAIAAAIKSALEG